jgi:UPF0271 protein
VVSLVAALRRLYYNGSVIIDLNADVGESPEPLASDSALMQHITSVNIACGGHAGDEHTMRQTLLAARTLQLAVGAHPSYPDRAHFGRVALPLPIEELQLSVQNQIAALASVAASLNMRLTHVKPHGALYHAAAHDLCVAQAVGDAVLAIDSQLIMVGQAGSPCLEKWHTMGLRCTGEAFADRAYEPDGSLRKRNRPGALLEDPCQAARQAVNIVLHKRVVACDGSELPVSADTLCIHSDTPNAAAIARAVNEQLRSAGVQIMPLQKWL